jgi:hypothetical protein
VCGDDANAVGVVVVVKYLAEVVGPGASGEIRWEKGEVEVEWRSEKGVGGRRRGNKGYL